MADNFEVERLFDPIWRRNLTPEAYAVTENIRNDPNFGLRMKWAAYEAANNGVFVENSPIAGIFTRGKTENWYHPYIYLTAEAFADLDILNTWYNKASSGFNISQQVFWNFSTPPDLPLNWMARVDIYWTYQAYDHKNKTYLKDIRRIGCWFDSFKSIPLFECLCSNLGDARPFSMPKNLPKTTGLYIIALPNTHQEPDFMHDRFGVSARSMGINAAALEIRNTVTQPWEQNMPDYPGPDGVTRYSPSVDETNRILFDHLDKIHEMQRKGFRYVPPVNQSPHGATQSTNYSPGPRIDPHIVKTVEAKQQVSPNSWRVLDPPEIKPALPVDEVVVRRPKVNNLSLVLLVGSILGIVLTVIIVASNLAFNSNNPSPTNQGFTNFTRIPDPSSQNFTHSDQPITIPIFNSPAFISPSVTNRNITYPPFTIMSQPRSSVNCTQIHPANSSINSSLNINARDDSSMRINARHSVESVAFSPDCKTLASGSDNTVRLWDVQTGQLKQFFAAHDEGINSVAFSPDGKTLASASSDKIIRLWDVANLKPLTPTLTGHNGTVYSVTFSPDGKIIASASDDATIRLWDAATGQTIGLPLTGHNGRVNSVAFSPDGKTLASTGVDGTVHLWNLATGAVHVVAPH